MGMRSPYLDWPRRWWRDAVDGEVTFGGSSERRLGVEAIPVKEGQGLDLIRSGREWRGEEAVDREDLVGVKRSWRIPARKVRRTSVAQGGRRGE
jgi:hypothetical protein